MNLAEKIDTNMPGCDYTPAAYDGPTKEQVLETRKRYCNPALFHYYKEPIMVVDGYMQYVFDETGRRYLDLIGGIVTISAGHCHPKVIERTKAQIDKIQHTTTIYLNPGIAEFAEKLASKMPDGLDVTYFVNSGSEANDLAMLMARLYTGNFDIVALQNCYHGAIASTMGLTSHNTWKFPVPQGYGVHHVPCPDPYRSPFSGSAEEIASQAVEEIKQTVRYETPGNLAGFIAEPIQGVGGATSGAANYLKEAYAAVREFGGVCISDEVQTGFGRTGENYWGFQNFDVKPDIVTMAKGIGNGIPLAAVTTTREIAEVMTQRIHFNTFGGNPVSMAQGLATLEVIDEDNLQQNCKETGSYLKKGLQQLMEQHTLIGDVRGMGLMLGAELVKDRGTKEPASEQTALLVEHMKDSGILLGKGGLFGNVLRIKPPMCVTKDDVDFTLAVLDQALTAVAS